MELVLKWNIKQVWNEICDNDNNNDNDDNNNSNSNDDNNNNNNNNSDNNSFQNGYCYDADVFFC